MSAGITPGPLQVYDANDGMEPQFMPLWCVANNNWHNSEDEEDLCIHATLDAGTKEDAELFAEASNVANETGLTPRQLADERDELLAAITHAVEIAEDRRGGNWDDVMQYRELINKVNGK